LCKCRVATSHFCFNHKAHVCAECLPAEHQNCVVRSYIRWLADSDYEWPHLCPVCKQPLEEGEKTIRLLCMDAFHEACLDKTCADLPSHTAPAGFVCPKCRVPFLPPQENKSALSTRLREFASSTEWGQRLAAHAAETTSPRAAPPATAASPATLASTPAAAAPVTEVAAAAATSTGQGMGAPAATTPGATPAASLRAKSTSARQSSPEITADTDDYSKEGKKRPPIRPEVPVASPDAKTHAPGGAFSKPLLEQLGVVRDATLPLPVGVKASAQRATVRRWLAAGLVACILLVVIFLLSAIQQALPEVPQQLGPPIA